MTEAEWLAATDLAQLVKKLSQAHFAGVSVRKWVLAEIAGTRRIVHLFRGDLGQRALEFATRAIEEPTLRSAQEYTELKEQLARYYRSLRSSIEKHEIDQQRWTEYYNAGTLLQFPPPLWSLCCGVEDVAGWGLNSTDERGFVAALLRDIFGNPFRPVTFSPDWHTDTAVSLARQMYDSRDFSAMPILADALQDAGCDSEDILSHCRSDGPHVRGCWVVDLLSKE